jgi:hypothetical protein
VRDGNFWYSNHTIIETNNEFSAKNESMYQSIKHKKGISSYADKKIKDFLQAKNTFKKEEPVKVSNVVRKLPQIRFSKLKVNVHSRDEVKVDRLPDLPSPTKKQIPGKMLPKKIFNSNTPASPPTSRTITLDTMLFGDNPKVVNPKLIEFKLHDITKVSTKKN